MGLGFGAGMWGMDMELGYGARKWGLDVGLAGMWCWDVGPLGKKLAIIFDPGRDNGFSDFSGFSSRTCLRKV